MKDIFTILGLFALMFLSYHIFYKGFVNSLINTVVHEGLDNAGDGAAVGAAKFATDLHETSTSLGDKLLIMKYRKEYDKVIMGWEAYVHNLMLETVLNADLAAPLVSMEKINTLNKSLESLAVIQEYVDTVK
jgi:hypothetical protein